SDLGAPAIPAVSTTTAYPQLLATSASVGHIYVKPEWDGVLRRIPHIITYRGKLYPSLALASAAHYLGVKPQEIVATGKELQIAGRRIPSDGNGEKLVNWVGGYRSFPITTFKEILQKRADGSWVIPDETFKDAVVLIGVIAAG